MVKWITAVYLPHIEVVVVVIAVVAFDSRRAKTFDTTTTFIPTAKPLTVQAV